MVAPKARQVIAPGDRREPGVSFSTQGSPNGPAVTHIKCPVVSRIKVNPEHRYLRHKSTSLTKQFPVFNRAFGAITRCLISGLAAFKTRIKYPKDSDKPPFFRRRAVNTTAQRLPASLRGRPQEGPAGNPSWLRRAQSLHTPRFKPVRPGILLSHRHPLPLTRGSILSQRLPDFGLEILGILREVNHLFGGRGIRGGGG